MTVPVGGVAVMLTDVSPVAAAESVGAASVVVPENAAQLETNWTLLQQDPPDGGRKRQRGKLVNQGNLGNGNHAVIRRYEFYTYAGAYDPITHEALCADGTCTARWTREQNHACHPIVFTDTGEIVARLRDRLQLDLPGLKFSFQTGGIVSDAMLLQSAVALVSPGTRAVPIDESIAEAIAHETTSERVAGLTFQADLTEGGGPQRAVGDPADLARRGGGHAVPHRRHPRQRGAHHDRCARATRRRSDRDG